MRLCLMLIALVAPFGAGANAAERAEGFLLKPIEGGGFAIERVLDSDSQKSVHGIATVAEIVTLLKDEAAAPEKIDFAAGQKLEGVFTVLVGRDDGTLGKFERASDVVIFAAPSSMTTVGDVTTLSGAVVFALKIDNANAASPVQRFETGAITLTRARKSL